MADLAKLDLYDILSVSIEATEKDIVKAYRKKALKCHPDKNPDNPKAAELFHQLSKALEVLTDTSARAAYDKILKARKAAEIRHRELDSKRKKLKEDLEAREKAAEQYNVSQNFVAKNLEKEIARLRREGSKLLEQEQQKLKEELLKEAEASNEEQSDNAVRLKLRWNSKKDDMTNGGYNHTNLSAILRKYGDVTTLLISSKRNGSAIVEFSSSDRALLAVETEIGLESNPLSITWLSGQIPVWRRKVDNTKQSHYTKSFTDQSCPKEESKDFESIVLMRMRQAEERKRLAEQMLKEEQD